MVLVLWFWWRRARMGRLMERPAPEGEAKTPLSLLICFKNEASHLKSLLPKWCEQAYSNYEVILVDDHSTDEGPELVRKAMKQYPHLRLIQLKPEDLEGKKAAQKKGILAAQNDALVFCDADCRPASNFWLKHISAGFEKHDVVLGFGALEGSGFIGALSEYETLETVIRYWSYAENGRPYMGVGRNLAYRKSAVPALEALDRHADLISGDDDLTLSELGKNSRVRVLAHPDSFTLSPSASNWKAWWRQKTRHYSTAWRYSPRIKLSLGLEGFLQLLYVLLLPFAVLNLPLYIVIGLVAARWVFGIKVYEYLQKREGTKSTLLFHPFLEMIWVLATTIIHLRNLILGPPRKW